MRVLLVEDDYAQSAALTDELKRTFAGAQVETMRTESEFKSRFDEIVSRPPDIVILDVMLPWTNPSPNVSPPPPEIAKEGHFRAGIRCQKMLSMNERTRPVPVIFYSALERGDYESALGDAPPNVVAISKGAEGRLSAVIRSVLHAAAPSPSQNASVFVVHGHDDEAKESVARFIERLGLHAIILHEQPSLGKTVIEKFEAYSNVAYAVVLLTPDGTGKAKAGKGEGRPRARQNVVFELGFFAAKLGRRNLCALYKPDVEIPSDFHGVLYIAMDPSGAWRSQLAREMKAAGLPVEMDRIL